MGEYTIQDFIEESGKQEEFYKEQISKFDNLLNDYKEKINELQNRKNSVLLNILLKFVPEFTKENLEKFSQKINSPQTSSLYQQYIEEGNKLKNKIAEIEKNDEYIKREALTDPESGVIPSQISEIKPLYDSAKVIYDKINQFPAFSGLKSRQYGTKSYPYQRFTKYFIPMFYQDWKNSDAIVAALNAKDFIDVLSQYEEAEKQVNSLGTAIKDYQDQISRIKNLTEEHDNSVNNLKDLIQNYYLKLGNILNQYLKSTDKINLQAFFKDHEELEEEFKKLDGLEHQAEYMKDLYEKVVNDRSKLVEKAGKIMEEAQRYKLDEYKYRNKRFTEDQFESKFDRDSARYDSMYDRYYGYGGTIYGFNDYSRSSLISDILWWDLITGGRINGNFIPEVYEYHNAHPDYIYQNPSADSSSDQS